MKAWIDYDVQFVRARYNKLATFYPLFELLFLLPPGIRSRTVKALKLNAGDSVFEVGCGTGRNLRYLVEAVGPAGMVYGADISEGMLAKAAASCRQNGWKNLTLFQGDAFGIALPTKVDAALFSLSYATMKNRRAVLARVWDQLHPGGRLVLMDARMPKGFVGRLCRPFALWTLNKTVLGNPDVDILQDLRELAGDIDVQELQFGSYFIGRATKPDA
jgi:ubiquinone/menaquinone biosynthesis C-methylase UbiE